MKRIDESHDGQAVSVALGQTLEICLEENPTTGFRWRLHSGGVTHVRLVRDYFEVASKTPGRGGRHHWLWEACRPGEERIELVYARPWASDSAAARPFTIRVQVSE